MVLLFPCQWRILAIDMLQFFTSPLLVGRFLGTKPFPFFAPYDVLRLSLFPHFFFPAPRFKKDSGSGTGGAGSFLPPMILPRDELMRITPSFFPPNSFPWPCRTLPLRLLPVSLFSGWCLYFSFPIFTKVGTVTRPIPFALSREPFSCCHPLGNGNNS